VGGGGGGGGGGQHHAPAALFPGKSPGTHCTGGQVDPRATLGGNGEEKKLLCEPVFEPRTSEL